MTEASAPEEALRDIVKLLTAQERRFAFVGGLAVSVRAEVRFTRDVDLVVAANGDDEAEALVRGLVDAGYRAVAIVEHEQVNRLSTVRLMGLHGVVVDLLFASTGLEHEIVDRATMVVLPNVGPVQVARSEELLAMKVLSMRDARLKDVLDARGLVEHGGIDFAAVRAGLALIRERGCDRGQDLDAKLDGILAAVEGAGSK